MIIFRNHKAAKGVGKVMVIAKIILAIPFFSRFLMDTKRATFLSLLPTNTTPFRMTMTLVRSAVLQRGQIGFYGRKIGILQR